MVIKLYSILIRNKTKNVAIERCELLPDPFCCTSNTQQNSIHFFVVSRSKIVLPMREWSIFRGIAVSLLQPVIQVLILKLNDVGKQIPAAFK